MIITTKGIDRNLKKVYQSLILQKYKPKKIIISSYNKLSNFFKCEIIYSSVQNQVYQRSKALKKVKLKEKDILVFLDDKIILDKNCLFELNKEWNSSKKNIAGIGLSCVNYSPPKVNFGHRFTHTNTSEPGKILKNGFVSGYGNLKKNIKVEWLNGGMTSWKYSCIKNNLSRNYPLINWSVGEDLIFSYNISKKYDLIVSKRSKCKIVPNNKKENLNDSFLVGYYHSFIIKSFIKANIKNFSILLYYYSVISSSIIGISLNLLIFDMKEIFRYSGRIIGSFSYFKNIK